MVFGSTQKLKFSNLNFASTFSSETQKPLRDCVKVLRINPTSDTNAVPLGQDYKFNFYGYYTYQDGYTDAINVDLLSRSDNDDYPNNQKVLIMFWQSNYKTRTKQLMVLIHNL